MQKRFCIVLLNLLLTVLSPAAAEGDMPSTTAFNHQYGIYFYSGEEGVDLFGRYGSYLRFQLKAGVGATYDCYIKEGVQMTGRVESVSMTAMGPEYVLEGFFDGRHNATMKILDMPDMDNLKTAIVYYTDQKKDPAAQKDSPSGTFVQLILNEDDFAPEIPAQQVKQSISNIKL